MVYVVIGLVAFLAYFVYRQGKLASELNEFRELNRELRNHSDDQARVIEERENELEVVHEQLVEIALENGDVDAAVDMFNELLQNKGSTGSLPN